METIKNFFDRLKGKRRTLKITVSKRFTGPHMPDKTKLILKRPVDIRWRISSPYGWREKPVPKFHRGIDFACPVGTPVTAFHHGRVYMVGWEDSENIEKGLGLRVWQEFEYNGFTVYGWYGHLSEILVDPGQEINSGDVIGLSGNTGSSTGPHLHCQWREKNTSHYFDAEFYLDDPNTEIS